MTEVKSTFASLEETEGAPLTVDEKNYRQLAKKQLIEFTGTQLTNEQKNRQDELKKQLAALDEKEKKYQEHIKQQQESDAKIPFKFIFEYPATSQSTDAKAHRGRVEVKTNRMLVTHPVYGLEVITTIIETYRNKPVPTAAEIKEYETLLAQRKPEDKVDEKFDRLETKVTDYMRTFEYLIPARYYQNFGPEAVQDYINWANLHLTSKNDEITDTTQEIKNDIWETYLSDPDLRFMEGLSDMKKNFVDQLSDIIGSLRPMALFVKYMGNKIILGYKEDDENIPGLVDFMCNYVLNTDASGTTTQEKFQIFNFDKEFYITPEEEKAMKAWVDAHGEPKDYQLFGFLETKGLTPEEIRAREVELKTLIGDPSRGIYGLASYWKRLNPDVNSALQTLIDNLRMARKQTIYTNDRGIQAYAAKNKQAGYVYLSIRDAMASGLIKRSLPEDILDDTGDWALANQSEAEIKEKFATTPVEGVEFPVEIPYELLLIIADYMKHFQGDDSRVSATGQWETSFLSKIRTSGQVANLIRAAEYLEMPRLANLFKTVSA